MMSEARRQQMRVAMLPHLSGKFDVETFLQTGSVHEYRAFYAPETPGLAAAREQVERERKALEERRRNAQ